jgi:putative pyruvate formate lyase activating enzyme
VSWPARLGLSVGDLADRAEGARRLLRACALCPRRCRADRLSGKAGCCGVGRFARVASYGPHHGEERCLSGTRGSGTIFFGGCSLGCAYCQNWDISHITGGVGGVATGEEVDAAELAGMMLTLQKLGCHNINLVTPSHVVPQILEALVVAVGRGLRLPVVYNTSAYDGQPALQLLDGVVDVYMPDFKYWSADAAERYLTARDYPEVARRAIAEMHRQVGDLVVDARGLARRGLLVRHLVMPGGLADSERIFAWLAELSPDTFVNVMSQYRPEGLAALEPEQYAPLAGRLGKDDYREALALAAAAGLRRSQLA